MAYRETSQIRTRKEQSRERILLAARELVAQGGFRNAQMSAIAESAGVATGTLYRYFASKEELCSELFRAATEHEIKTVAKALTKGGDAIECLSRALGVFAQRALKGPTMAWSLIAEPVDPQVDADRLFYRQAYAELFEKAICAGVDQGLIPPQDTRTSAAALVGAISETLVGPLAPARRQVLGENTEADQQQLIASIICFCLQALTGKPYLPTSRSSS